MQEVPQKRQQLLAALEAASAEFLKKTGRSQAAEAILRLLMTSLQESRYPTRYSEGSRNSIVGALATDIEHEIGAPASLLFRTPGELHDSLQSLLDAYLDAVDAAAAD